MLGRSIRTGKEIRLRFWLAGLPTIIWFIFIDFSQSLYYVKVFVGYVLSSLKSMPLIKQK